MNSKIFLPIIILSSILISSCSDFLDEVNKTGKTGDLVFSTESSLDGLVASCYAYNRLWYGKEGGFNLTEGGTDLWYNASDCKAIDLVTYKNVTPDEAADKANNNSCIDEYWEAFYAAINQCNLTLELIEASDVLTSEKKIRMKSEVLFLRAFYYWHLVETWGAVQVNLESVNNPSTVARRDKIENVYKQMFEDVQFAIDNLAISAPSSRVSYWAAKAFKARLALYYASEYDNSSYYSIAAQEAKDVIDGLKNSGRDLYSNYNDVWDITKSSTTTNNEFIWAIDYYNTIGTTSSYNFLPKRMKVDANGNPVDWASIIIRRTEANGSGGGNIMHVTCTPVWQNQTNTFNGASLSDVLVRNAGLETTAKYYTVASPSTKVQVDLGYWYVKYGLGYARFAPTRYLLDLYADTIDQRYNGTFRTAWYKHPSLVPKDYGSAACKYPNMSTGTQTDTCLFWSKRPLTAAQITWATGRYKYFDVTWTFKADGVTPDVDATKGTAKADQFFPMLRKFENTDSKITIPATTFQDYFSYRDFPVFRLSEMYLIAAEAEITSNQSDALNLFNYLRTKRAISGKESEMQVTSVDLDLILAERAREFAGEYIRWYDLKRTKKLESQIVNNTNAKDFFDASKHYLRPIPSVQMNAVSNRTDNPDPNGFWQNPGY